MNLPIAPLPPIQSLGYLQSGQMLRFRHEGWLSLCDFKTGESYPVQVVPVTVMRTVKRPSHSGPEHEHALTGHDLMFIVTQGDGNKSHFIDRRHCGQGITIHASIDGLRKPIRPHFPLETLTAHFEIPTPPDVAMVNQSHFLWGRDFLKFIEGLCDTGFHWKPFQIEDVARFSIPDGAIFSGECGTGKTPMGVGWALLKVGLLNASSGSMRPAAPVLIIAPAGLMDQMEADYRNLFGSAWPGVTRIPNQAAFCRLLAENGGKVPPGFYMASYQQVALNRFQILPRVPDGPLPASTARAYMDFFGAPTLEDCRRISNEAAAGIGEHRGDVRCVFKPSLAELINGYFDAILIDEGTHCKGEDTIIGLGVRSLNPKYRLVLTGTPVKNRLPDILYLAAWACDAIDKPSDRWPYAGERVADFAKDFQVFSRDMTLEARARLSPGRSTGNRTQSPSERLGLPIAEISNVQKLYTVLAPVVLRRRKSDISEQEIVPKIHKRIVVNMSGEQARLYQHYLTAPNYDRRGQPAVGSKIMALRTIAAAHCAFSLGELRGIQMFTPKVHACLEIVGQALERGEQVVIFSPFHDPLDVLSQYLAEAHIPHDVLDGRLSPTKRAVLAANFKRGPSIGNPVLLAGLKACAEGYSFEKCNNVIIFAFDWALDLLRQAVDRCHRINSTKPVNVYTIVVAGSIEMKLESMLEEKGDAADIALNGAPAAFSTEDMKLEDLLASAESEFLGRAPTDPDCQGQEWPALRSKLFQCWNGRQQEVAA